MTTVEHWTQKQIVEGLRAEAISNSSFIQAGFITSILVANGGGLLSTVTLIAGMGSGDKARFAAAVSRLPGAGCLFVVGIILSYFVVMAVSIAAGFDKIEYEKVLSGERPFTGEIQRMKLYTAIVACSVLAGICFLMGIGVVCCELPFVALAGK